MLKLPRILVLTAVVCATALAATTSVAAEPAPVAAESSDKLKTGLTPLVSLLKLMDTDRNGKVSKTEFMRFMEAEFDFADKNHDGQLDPEELKTFVYRLTHPESRLPRVRK